jgi:hypothetical protein
MMLTIQQLPDTAGRIFALWTAEAPGRCRARLELDNSADTRQGILDLYFMDRWEQLPFQIDGVDISGDFIDYASCYQIR